MQPIKLMICRFPFGRSEDPDVCDWLVPTTLKIHQDPRIQDEIVSYRVDDTPITMSRNRAIKVAIEEEVDMMLMVDSDMKPDAYLPGNQNAIAPLEGVQPFWDTSFNHLWHQRKQGTPAVIAAPYCGPAPASNVYCFFWQTNESDAPDDEPNFHIEQYHRDTAARMHGIQECAALPTGLILMDMEAVKKLRPPYTYYEWPDAGQDDKASTEDVVFTRDMSLLGVKQYCNWDAWAGHWKWKCVGRPHLISPRDVADNLKAAWKRELNIGDGEKMINVKNNGRAENIRAGAAQRPHTDQQSCAVGEESGEPAKVCQ